jgi:TonB family protein
MTTRHSPRSRKRGRPSYTVSMLRWTASLTLAVLAASLTSHALAQSAPQPAALSAATLVPVELPHPVYPPIAQAARVQGDVEVTVTVRPDGSVATAAVTGADMPLLGPAAVNAAKNARFECRGCDGAPTPAYSIVYAFNMNGTPDDSGEVQQPALLVESSSRSRVTTVVETPLLVCGYRSELAVRARSIKCAWLWKCGYDVQ